jgi:hypothetical protein
MGCCGSGNLLVHVDVRKAVSSFRAKTTLRVAIVQHAVEEVCDWIHNGFLGCLFDDRDSNNADIGFYAIHIVVFSVLNMR